jgi:hypothetical protein
MPRRVPEWLARVEVKTLFIEPVWRGSRCNVQAKQAVIAASLLLGMMLSIHASKAANLLTNGSFRFGSSLSPSGWTIDPTGLYWNRSYGQDDSFSVSLLDNDPPNHPGDDYLSQSINVTKGAVYRVTWWRESEGYSIYGNNTNINLTVASGGTTSTNSIHLLTDPQWRLFTLDFTAEASTATVLFTADSGNLLAADLDNVSVDWLAAPALGDYNGDGIVDAADYTIWRDTLGSTTDLRANGDNTGASAGVIDQADYVFWKSHFGNHAGSGAGGGANAGVPEPTTGLMLLVGILTLCHCRRQTCHKLMRP